MIMILSSWWPACLLPAGVRPHWVLLSWDFPFYDKCYVCVPSTKAKPVVGSMGLCKMLARHWGRQWDSPEGQSCQCENSPKDTRGKWSELTRRKKVAESQRQCYPSNWCGAWNAFGNMEKNVSRCWKMSLLGQLTWYGQLNIAKSLLPCMPRSFFHNLDMFLENLPYKIQVSSMLAAASW